MTACSRCRQYFLLKCPKPEILRKYHIYGFLNCCCYSENIMEENILSTECDKLKAEMSLLRVVLLTSFESCVTMLLGGVHVKQCPTPLFFDREDLAYTPHLNKYLYTCWSHPWEWVDQSPKAVSPHPTQISLEGHPFKQGQVDMPPLPKRARKQFNCKCDSWVSPFASLCPQ